MCGRFTLTRSGAEVAEHFALADVPVLQPRYNAAPGQDVAVVVADPSEPGVRRLAWRRWGLVPSFAERADAGPRPINVRVETAARRPAFREAMQRRRCLIPADGFYEWSGSGRQRRPHWIARADAGLFAMAGIFERWHEGGGDALATCAVLTRESEGPVRGLHDRMPVILARDHYAAWLDPQRGAEAAAALAAGEPADPTWRVRPVDRRVNDPRHDDPACLEPPAEETLPLFGARER